MYALVMRTESPRDEPPFYWCDIDTIRKGWNTDYGPSMAFETLEEAFACKESFRNMRAVDLRFMNSLYIEEHPLLEVFRSLVVV